MPKIIIICFCVFACFTFLPSCAEIQPLTGGERDKQPPRLDSARYSTPNKSVNFAEKEIILTFDEWIQLDQAQNKILISPPTAEKPTFKLKHKSLLIKFNEDLRPNTTYTINLGDAVKDLSEGNIAKNFNFVFSTGTFIDSLKVRGTIVDAQTGLGRDNIWVMLYDQRQDSTPLLQKPYYITKTETGGSFLIENVKSDSFKIFALLDKNSNYIFDAQAEEIAFWDEDFLLTDSTQPVMQLRLFLPKQKQKLLSQKFMNKGTARFAFNTPIEKENFTVRPLFDTTANYRSYQYANADSVYLWLKGDFQKDSTYRFLLADKDTAKIVWAASLDTFPKPSFVVANAGKSSSKASSKKAALPTIKQNPNLPLRLLCNAPITQIDSSQILVYRDTILDSNRVAAPFFYVDSAANFAILADIKTWKPATYTILFLPKSVNNFFNIANTDTLRQTIQIMKPSDFGRLKVSVKNLDSLANNRYIFQLLRGKDEIIHSQNFDNEQQSTFNLKFDMLDPASYTVRIILDSNKNGIWDTGDYLAKQQPERIINSKATSVRADWDNEMEVDINPPAKTSKAIGNKMGKNGG
jgi:hypothetical protein